MLPWARQFLSLPCISLCARLPLSMEFSRQQYWSGLPFPSSGDFPNPGIKPTSPAWQVDSLTLSHLVSPNEKGVLIKYDDFQRAIISLVCAILFSFSFYVIKIHTILYIMHYQENIAFLKEILNT